VIKRSGAAAENQCMARRSLLLLLPLLVVAAGCGGSIVRGERLAEALDPNGSIHGAWVARANQICADRAAAVRRLPTPGTQTELIDAGARIVSIEELEHSRLASSRPPIQDRDDLNDFLDSIELVQRGIERVSTALDQRDGADLAQARAALAEARRESNKRARGLGLTCRH
jgi:hypothetical protein